MRLAHWSSTFLLALVACGGDAGEETTDTQEEPVDCSTRPTDIPTARGEMEAVYSPVTGQMVFFGGDEGVPVQCQSQTSFVDDTWLYETDCGNWRRVEGEAPDATARYAASYDAARDRYIIHGGRFRDGTSGLYTLRRKTWAFDFASSSWSLLSEDGGPSVRAIHAGVITGDRFVVYGGTGSKDGAAYGPVYDETWVFDLATDTWTELDTTGGPGGRIFHAMATDGADRVWLFGGGDENAFFGPFYSDMWELDLSTNTWTELAGNTGRGVPEGRIGADLLYDEAENRLLVWGGHDITDLGNNNQLYAFSLDDFEWTLLRQGDVIDAGSNGFCDFPADFVAIEEGSPERRYLSASVLTPERQLYTFGGKTDCGIINDLWSYDVAGDAWSMHTRATDGESCVRAYDDCSSLCF
jgi:hypothetical protein